MGDYATIDQVRATDGMDSTDTFPDTVINEAITYAELIIDEYTGTSWIYKTFTVTLTGDGSRRIFLQKEDGRPVLFPRTLSSVTTNGVAETGLSTWALYPEGVVIRDIGCFLMQPNRVGRNIVMSGTAGFSSVAPADIAWCARTLARQYAIDLRSRVPDRALQIQNDFGTVMLAQAGSASDRPTSLPEVNARLVRRRHWSDSL